MPLHDFKSHYILILYYTSTYVERVGVSQHDNACSFIGRSRTSSDKNLQIVEGGQYLVEVEQALTKIFRLLKAVSI
jgi:hypothetical protein